MNGLPHRAVPLQLSRRLAKIVSILILVDVAVIAAIAVTGGFNVQIGPIPISAREIFNPLQAFWILVALSLWLRLRPRIDIRRSETVVLSRVGGALLIMTVVFLVAAAPIVWNGVGLLLRGEYVTQQYFWRSAPEGIDIATLVLGNPFHGLWGDGVQRVYQTLGIDAIESTGWLGIAPVVLAVWALRRHLPRFRNVNQTSMGDGATSRIVRQWAVIGLVFLVWALGPHLMAFGTNIGMILPQALLRYVPVVNNARIPGRAIVVAHLALAVLTAVAAAEWRPKSRGSLVALIAIALVVIADYVPAPFPVVAIDRPAIYEMLRDRVEEGAVCELPFGFRHGFGGRGTFDDRVLFYQTIHQRPLVGGFVARLPRAVAAAYEDDPLLAGLLSLSEPDAQINSSRPLPSAQLAADRLRENRITFVMFKPQWRITEAGRIRGACATTDTDRSRRRAVVVSRLAINHGNPATCPEVSVHGRIAAQGCPQRYGKGSRRTQERAQRVRDLKDSLRRLSQHCRKTFVVDAVGVSARAKAGAPRFRSASRRQMA